MVRVVVDTNVVGGAKSRPFTTQELRRLLDETTRGNLTLVVPEIVLRECSNLYADYLLTHEKALRSASSALAEAGELLRPQRLELDRDKLRSDAEATFRAQVSEAGGLIPQLPAVSHDQLVERALSRRKPFDKNGQNGYRDVLLWETIKSLDDEHEAIILVAHDKRAFFDDDPEKGLATSLRKEAAEHFGRADPVEAFFEPDNGLRRALAAAEQSAREARRDEIERQRRADEDAAIEIKTLLDKDLSFLTLVADAVDEALRDMDLGLSLTAFGVKAEGLHSAFVSDIESLHDWSVLSAHVTTDGTVLCEISALIRGAAAVRMPRMSAAALEGNPRVWLVDQEPGSTVEASIDISAHVVVDLVVDVHEGRLLSLATVSRFAPIDLSGESETEA